MEVACGVDSRATTRRPEISRLKHGVSWFGLRGRVHRGRRPGLARSVLTDGRMVSSWSMDDLLAARELMASRVVRGGHGSEASRLDERCQAAVGLRVARLLGYPELEQARRAAGHAAGWELEELDRIAAGHASEARVQCLLAFVAKVVADRGHHGRFVVDTVRTVGCSDVEILDVLATIQLDTLNGQIRLLLDEVDERSTRGPHGR